MYQALFHLGSSVLSMVFGQPIMAVSLAAQGFETINCSFEVIIGYSKSPNPYRARLSDIFEPENCQPSTEEPPSSKSRHIDSTNFLGSLQNLSSDRDKINCSTL